MDFDTPTQLIGQHSLKWDSQEQRYGIAPEDGLAMWVADMDFRTAPEVQAALRDAVDLGVYGYYGDYAPWHKAICGWMQRRHGWHVEPAWIKPTTGLVAAVGHAVRAYTKPDETAILFTPVYHAFARVIKDNGRDVHEAPLVWNNGQYEMDIPALEASLTGKERMLVLCSPHNPGGRIWTQAELNAVADFCIKHDLLLISDEVHHDIVMPGQKHHVLATLRPDLSPRLITLVAASKAFNLAGGMCGIAVIEDETLRTAFLADCAASGSSPNRFGMIMTEAAYTHGDKWMDALCAYLAENVDIFQKGVTQIPGVKMHVMQSTYLAWVDFNALGMTREEIEKRVWQDAKISANDGPSFGTGGEGFMRFNLATTHARVEEAVSRLQAAFGDLQ